MGVVVELKQARRRRLPKNQRVKVQLDQEQLAYLDAVASRERCSRSAVIGRAVTQQMNQARSA